MQPGKDQDRNWTRNAPGKPVLKGVNWGGLKTLYIKEVRRFFKVQMQTVWAPAITTLLYLAIFTVALGRGGKLTVGTRRVDDQVEITVRDTGSGIAPEVGKRLFEQFFTTKPQGTGLGLYISRQIIEEQHGGTLTWESAPGQGTTFTATLPIKRAQDV